MNVLIIEDEIKTGKELRRLIEGLDDTITVVEVLTSVKSAIAWFGSHPPPDLIFSDIQLGDGLSLDIFRQVSLNGPVVFCTAFDEYAIQAFEANSIDYLLKPVDEGRLGQSLEKFKKLKEFFGGGTGDGRTADRDPTGDYKAHLGRLAGQFDSTYKRTILVHLRERIVPIKTADIAYAHAAHGLVNLVTRQNHPYACQYTMDQVEAMLDPRQFYRANRQYIINREAIQNVEHYFNRRLYIKTSCPTPDKVIISKVKATEFLKWMEW
jgi:DNA-binding LytR/AlgR family response regulator